MSHEDSREDQNQPDATPVEQPQTIPQRLRDLSRRPRTGDIFVKGSSLGPLSIIPLPSIPPFEGTPQTEKQTAESQPEPSREQLRKFLIDFLDSMASTKALKQAPWPDPDDTR